MEKGTKENLYQTTKSISNVSVSNVDIMIVYVEMLSYKLTKRKFTCQIHS